MTKYKLQVRADDRNFADSFTDEVTGNISSKDKDRKTRKMQLRIHNDFMGGPESCRNNEM